MLLPPGAFIHAKETTQFCAPCVTMFSNMVAAQKARRGERDDIGSANVIRQSITITG